MGGGPLLRMAGIAKGFPGVQALRGGRLRRSAAARCMRCWARTAPARARCSRSWPAPQTPDAGTITFDGATVRLASPHAAQELGIVTIYQEFNLIPTLSVAENVFIGRAAGAAAAASTGRALHRRTKALTERGRPRRRPAPAGLRPLGRRAADGRDRARSVARGQARGHGRADLGPVRQGGPAPVRHRARAQGQGHLGRLRHPPARGGAADLRPRHRAARRRPGRQRPRSPSSTSSGSSA